MGLRLPPAVHAAALALAGEPPEPVGECRMEVEFTIPLKVVSEMNERGHWATRKRRFDAQKRGVDAAVWPVMAVFKAFQEWRAAGSGRRYAVTLTRVGKRLLDGDNLQGACKAIRDRIAFWLGADDGSEVYCWEYGQEAGAGYAVRIRIRTHTEGAA